jgi:arylsulfatase A-like enzyme
MKARYISFLVLLLFSCRADKVGVRRNYATRYVIVIVVDGPRWSETWGDQTQANIPYRSALLSEGVLVDQFFNNGPTITVPGHTAIVTGNYDALANNGSELPHHPTLFQEWLRLSGEPATTAWIIASKDKLHMLTNSQAEGFHDAWTPSDDCGQNGDGTGGYRSDPVTHAHVLQVLGTHHPRLLLVNYKDPDVYAHGNNYSGYLSGIQQTDAYIAEIWDFIQNDPLYKDKTTLIVTNDHGRHLDGTSVGFVSHGDDCAGCRHIEFFALSPDFRKNAIVHTPYEQIDIAATISELLHIPLPDGKGKIMEEVFK